jgi:tetratricopeptide (TPR) repeat protein
VYAGNNNAADSLMKIIKTSKQDTTVIRAYIRLGEILVLSDPDSTLKLQLIARERAEKLLASSPGNIIADTTRILLGYAINNIGYIYQQKGNYDLALEYYNKNLKIQEETNDKKGMALTLNNIGYIYSARGNIKDALDFFNKSLVLQTELKNQKGIALNLNNIAFVFKGQGDTPRALDNFWKSFKIREQIGDKQGMAQSLNNISSIYFDLKEYDKALEMHEKSLAIRLEIGDKNGMAYSLNNIGAVYQQKKDYNKAAKYFEESLAIRIEIGDKKGMAYSYNCLGYLCQDLGKHSEALNYFNKSLLLREELNDLQGKAITLVNLGKIYLAQGKTAIALKLGEDAYKMSLETGFPLNIKVSASLLKEIYRQLGNYKKAFDFYHEEIRMKDSLDNEEYFKQAMKQQARYEYEKKAATDSLEHVKAIEIKNIEIAKVEEEKKKQRIILIAFIAGFILITVFSFALFRLFVQKKRANKILAEQKRYIELQNKNLLQANEEISAQRDEIEAQRDEIAAQRDLVTGQKEHIEEQKKEITDSITYARRIQKAVLPDLDMVFGNSLTEGASSFCCDYFVLYKPKDIVSGDFYWATRIGDWCIFTVADCTGHGVPGAFMSMLGISNLNEIVRRKEITKTGDVLDQLRNAVIEALRQKGVTGEQKDGMDIVFCAYNNQTRILQYSGANNSLYILKEDATGYELNEYKADPQPVAIHVSMTNFTTHEIPVEKGDMLYLISDGYADQFGGPKNKKFMIKRLRELFVEIAPMSLYEQQTVLSAEFEKWTSGAEQVDDVTIMGVRL